MIFLLGGARSGKSRIAVSLAAGIGGPVTFIATAREEDDEMSRRIEEHRRHRPELWRLLEAPLDLAAAIESASDIDTIVVDCVTLWVSNLMTEHGDEAILSMVESVIATIEGRPGESIVVSNEVGSGLVPMHQVGRRFRDLQGRANQSFARAAHTAYLAVAGRALPLQDLHDDR